MVALGVWLWGCCVGKLIKILQESLEDIARVQTQSKHQGRADVPTESFLNLAAALISFPNYCSLALPLGHNHRSNT